RAVVLGDLGLDHDLWVELARYDEIGRLVKALNALRTLGLAEANACTSEYTLDRAFQHVTYQTAHRITMPSKGATEKALVEQHRIGPAEIGERLNAGESVPRVGLVKTVQVLADLVRHPLGQQFACRRHHRLQARGRLLAGLTQ